MAKGDSDRSQNQINAQGGLAQNTLNNTRTNLSNQQGQFWNNYQGAVPGQLSNYNEIMNNYNSFLAGQNPGQQPQGSQKTGQFSATGNAAQDIPALLAAYGKSDTGAGSGITDANYWINDAMKNANGDEGYVLGRLESDLQGKGPDAGGGGGTPSAVGGFQNFAQTGGFSPEDLQNIRNRATSGIRSAYSSAQDNIERQRRLQNGYSPNYTAAQAKMARDESQSIADANTNANAAIAQMVQQGKLYGLTGLSNAQLGALGAQTGLYGTNPALINTFGNQVLQSGNQQVSLQGLQNQLAGEIMQAQNQKAGIPGNYQQALGNIGSTLGLIGTTAGAFGGF